MFTREGALSIPFRLAISIIVLSLAMPICISCFESGNSELSRNLALEISKMLADAISFVSERGFGESRLLDLTDHIRMLSSSTELIIGDYPGGSNSSLIVCMDSSSWKRVINTRLDHAIDGICSSNLSPFTIGRNSPAVMISHRCIQNMNLVIVEET